MHTSTLLNCDYQVCVEFHSDIANNFSIYFNRWLGVGLGIRTNDTWDLQQANSGALLSFLKLR